MNVHTNLYSDNYSDVLNELQEVIDEWRDVNESFMATIPFRYEALNINYQKWSYIRFLSFINEQVRIDYSNLLRDYYNRNQVDSIVPWIQQNKTNWWNDIIVNRSREYVESLDVLIPEVKWIILSFM